MEFNHISKLPTEPYTIELPVLLTKELERVCHEHQIYVATVLKRMIFEYVSLLDDWKNSPKF